MRTSKARKLDVSVGRGRKSWTCPYVFNGLGYGAVKPDLTPARGGRPLRNRGDKKKSVTEEKIGDSILYSKKKSVTVYYIR